MAYLLYGIVKDTVVVDTQGSDHDRIHTGDRSPDAASSGHRPGMNPGNLKGVKDRPVFFVAGHGLCAAVSELDVEEGAPPVSELLVYSRVVEDLHRLQAVVPMRYGCFLNGMESIRKILGERQRQYHALLEELDGRVEMGIRILLPEKRADPRQEEQPADGRNYLLQRKAHYRMREESSRQHRMLVEHCLQAFAGLYGNHRTETAVKNGTVILSLYFLVLRIHVARFQETFGKLAANGKTQSLLSGPWPPYNFVTPDLAPAK